MLGTKEYIRAQLNRGCEKFIVPEWGEGKSFESDIDQAMRESKETLILHKSTTYITVPSNWGIGEKRYKTTNYTIERIK